MTSMHPRVVQHRSLNLAQSAATDATTYLGVAPFDGTVTAAAFIPSAAITGATATKRTFTIVNKKADASGSTVMATLDFVTNTNGVAHVPSAFTLSAVANATSFVAGDVIACVETHASTGTANPGGQVSVDLSRS